MNFTNFCVGSLLMTLLVLIVYGSIFCPRCSVNNYQIKMFPPNMKGNYSEILTIHRRNNFDRFRDVNNFLNFADGHIYTDSQINEFALELHESLFGNTHSESPSSEHATNVVDDIKDDILKMLGTNGGEYTVIFTQNEAHAIKTFLEAFPFNKSANLFYSKSSSIDVLKLRHLTASKDSKASVFSFSELPETSKENPSVFVFPLVDGFDGTVCTEEKISSLLEMSKRGTAFTLVEASSYLSYNSINLKKTPFTAVAIGFDKVFGFPHLGALVISTRSLIRGERLLLQMEKPYFGGGTLVYALTQTNYEKFRLKPAERFEDGSLPFLNIAGVKYGMNLCDQFGKTNISQHVQSKIAYIKNLLLNLTHKNGKSVCRIYGKNHESMVGFNILNDKGDIIPVQDVLSYLRENNLTLSNGCQSHPISCYKALGIDEAFIKQLNDKFDPKNYGALRVSVGWATANCDIKKLYKLIKQKYVN